MKTVSSTVFFVVFIILVMLLGVCAFLYVDASREAGALYDVVGLKEAELKKSKDEYGREVAEFKAAMLDMDVLIHPVLSRQMFFSNQLRIQDPSFAYLPH